jgi:hypothetical protein
LNRAAAANAGVPGQAVPSPTAPGMPATTTPANTYQVPGTTGTVVNPAGAGGVQTYPGTTTYSSNYYAPGARVGTYPGTSTGATPGYANRVMPGMAGYNTVNPMPTTMAPGYYYAGTGGMPYATYNTPGSYSSGNVTPGYYNTQAQTYPIQPRRGLFGFGRRNRMVYPASPYGTTTNSPYGYSTYGTTTYSPYNSSVYGNRAYSPSGYSTYGTTTYSTVPGTYTYGAAPY